MFIKHLHSSFKVSPFYLSTERGFWKWVNTVFNKVDYQRIKEVGADQAAAEWLLKCGAHVKWKNNNEWVSNYDNLLKQSLIPNVIEEIDATESCVMEAGFFYLSGLKSVKKIRFKKCIYLNDICLNMLSVTQNSLEHLEILSCGNVTDNGLHFLIELKKLKWLHLYDLPEVKNKDECVKKIKLNIPECVINFP